MRAVVGRVRIARHAGTRRTVIVTVVTPRVRFAVSMRAIRPPFRIEWRLNLADRTTEPQQHFGENVIRLNKQAALAKLYRDMPVAEMVGGADQLQGVTGTDFEQCFRCGLDSNHAAIAGEQSVAVAQHGAGRKDIAKLLAAGQGDALPALAAGIIRQHQTVTGRCLAVSEGFGE